MSNKEAGQPKEFILVVDEKTMSSLTQTIPGIKCIPVVGLSVPAQDEYLVLATPATQTKFSESTPS